jgi:hypothetical protein
MEKEVVRGSRTPPKAPGRNSNSTLSTTIRSFLGAATNSGAASIATFVHDGNETFVNGIVRAPQGGEPTIKAPMVKRFAGGHLAVPLWAQNKNHAEDSQCRIGALHGRDTD